MGHRLALERFDGSGSSCGRSEGARRTALSADPSSDGPPAPVPVATPGHLSEPAARTDALLPEPAEDAGTKAARLAGLVGSLAEIVRTAAARDRRAERLAAEAFGRAAARAIPRLAREGFPAEVAGAALAVLGRGSTGAAILRLSPADLCAVQACLASGRQAEALAPLTLASDPALPPGRAALDWDGGGADFCADALGEAALALLARHLPQLSPQSCPDPPPAGETNVDPGPDPRPPEETAEP